VLSRNFLQPHYFKNLIQPPTILPISFSFAWMETYWSFVRHRAAFAVRNSTFATSSDALASSTNGRLPAGSWYAALQMEDSASSSVSSHFVPSEYRLAFGNFAWISDHWR